MNQWVTTQQATKLLGVTRRTIERWKHRYPIRQIKIKGHPTMLHLKDLQKAEAQATQNNPAVAQQ